MEIDGILIGVVEMEGTLILHPLEAKGSVRESLVRSTCCCEKLVFSDLIWSKVSCFLNPRVTWMMLVA